MWKNIFGKKAGNRSKLWDNKLYKGARSMVESTVGAIDGFVEGATGINLVGDDYFGTNTGEGFNSFTKNVAPMAVGLATTALTGSPQLGQLAGGASRQLSQNPTDPIIAQDGAMVMQPNPMYNIEKGELIIDEATLDIVQDLDSPKHKPHSKIKSKEHAGNFMEIQPGSVIIPKKYAEQYKKNPELRQGIMRNVVNMHKDRIMYGKDANGNVQEYNKIANAQVAETGLKTQNITSPLDPFGVPINLGPNNNPYSFDNMSAPENWNTISNYTDNTDFGNTVNLQQNNNPYSFNNTQMPEPQFSAPKKYFPGGTASPNEFIQPTVSVTSTGNDLPFTTGDYFGMVGGAIGALGPLGTTLARGVDRDEVNTFEGVSNRAENRLSSILGRSRDEAFRTMRANVNPALDVNRNSTSSFSTMSGRNQAIINDLNLATTKAGLTYDTQEANALAGMALQGDQLSAAGRERQLDRLDRNIDNYYSNISDNLSNLGTNVQATGQQLNKRETNKILLKTLQETSPYFTMDKKGNILFKGQPITK